MNAIPRILLVDDEPGNLRLLEKTLQGNYEIFSAGNGFDASSYCKKIRDDHEIWQRLETYICQHSEAVFSHGICPECYEVQSKEWDKVLAVK